MEIMKMIREFHWITKAVIGLTGLLLGLILVAAIVQVYAMSNRSDQNAFQAGQGLGFMAISLASVLWQAFLLLLIVIAIYMAATRIKMWIEKYLDAVIARLDYLAEQKNDREKTGAILTTMNGKVDGIEKKLEKIERILENVAE